MSKINYKKLYEESIFDKINLQKQIDEINLKLNDAEKLIDMNNINFKELYEKILIENTELKDKLKKYTAPKRSKIYYEKNKEKIIEKIKANKPTPEKIKEYNKKSYQNRKLKKQLEEQIMNNEKINL